MTASREFQNQLTDFLPKMRIWAMALTRNRALQAGIPQITVDGVQGWRNPSLVLG
jgi:hypothetical protein